MENKHCRECGKPIFGRIDKKYCSDICRHAHNNRERSLSGTYVNNINAILRKNRNILASLFSPEPSKIHKDKLNERGFNFNFITQRDEANKEPAAYYCYEFGYQVTENDVYYIVRKENI